MTQLATAKSFGLATIFVSVFGATASAQDLAVELQCWQGTAETTLLSRLTFDEVIKPFGCKVLVSNNTGTDISNADFALTFGEHPTVPLTQNPLTNNYDPAAYYNCPAQPPTGTTFRPNMVLDIVASFPGFAQGTQQTGTTSPYGLRCFDYNTIPRAAWRVSIAAGATATMRTEFKVGYLLAGANFTTNLRLDVTNLPAGVTFAPRTLPIDASLPVHPFEVVFTVAPIQSPTLAMAGTLRIGTGLYTLRGSNSGTNADFYLPYLRTSAGGVLEAVADGGYDPTLGHLLLFDPDDLELNTGYSDYFNYLASRFRDAKTGEDTTVHGGLALPLVRIKADHYHIDFGHLSGNQANLGTRSLAVSWTANYSRNPAVQNFLAARTTVLTGRFCARSDQSPEVCSQTVPNLYPEANLITRLFDSITYGNINGIAHGESSAATPFTVLGIWTVPPYTPWRDASMTLVSQVPNNSLGQRAAPYNIRNTTMFSPRPNLGFISTTVADQGFEEALLSRTVPLTGPTGWTAVGDMALGVAITDATTEVRTECQPSRYGVRNFSSSDECRQLVDYRVPRNARPSIDSSLYNATNMTRSSLGSTGSFTIRLGEAVVLQGKKSFNFEVDGGSRYSVSLLRDTTINSNWAFQRWSGVGDRTTGQYASLGCAFANLGLDNVRGPVALTIDWPIGYEPTSVNGDLAPSFRAIYGNQTLAAQGGNWGSALGTLVPADRYTIAIDRAARRAVITFAGPRADGTFPGSDQVELPLDYTDARWVGVRIDGEHVPGVDRFPVWNCKANVSESLAPNGTQVLNAERAFPPDAPFRILGPPAPVVSGLSNPTRIPQHGVTTSTIEVRNAAYSAAGVRLPNGAALSARDTAIFYRVPRNGDAPPDIQNGNIDAMLLAASSPELAAIWVSTDENPTRSNTTGLVAPAWTRCSEPGLPCDANAMAAISIVPAAVRWVAFELGELSVTDAEPRGVKPGSGVARVENPYYFSVQLLDRGSDGEALLRPIAELHSSDTLVLSPESNVFDVVVFDGCSALITGTPCTAGIGDCAQTGEWLCESEAQVCSAAAGLPTDMGPEVCDGRDNDCDGLTDGFDPTLEQHLCEKQLGVCLGSVAPASRCVPIEAGATWLPCEGVDYAAWAFATTTASNGQPGTHTPTEALTCDGLDNDCDGTTDEGFVGTAVSCGVGECRVTTTTVCVGGQVVDRCTPRTPTAADAEVCDNLDNDCDGRVDAGPSGSACPDVDTVIVACPATPTSLADFAFEYFEPVAEGDLFQCKLDAGAWQSCDGGAFEVADLADGSHTLLVRALGPYGRVDATPAFCTWVIDNSVPDTFILAGPENPSQTGSGDFLFGANIDNPSGYFCTLAAGSAPATPPAYPYPACPTLYPFVDLADGLWTLHVYVRSAAGVLDPTPAVATWLIDTDAPGTVLNEVPEPTVCGNTATFDFTSPSESHDNRPKTFECRLDAAAWSPCTTPVTHTGLTDGPHVFEVRAIDGAGNADPTPARATFTVDTTAPVTRMDVTAPNPSQSGTATFVFSANDPNTTFECAVKPALMIPSEADFVACTSPHTVSSLQDGVYTMHVRGRGAFCGLGSPATATWLIDSTFPETAYLTTPPTQVGPSYESTFTFHDPTDADVDTFECQLDDGAWTNCDGGELDLGPQTVGPHKLLARSCKWVGQAPNTTRRCDPTPATFAWVVTISECPLDTTPPTISCQPTTTVECVAGAGTFDVTGLDATTDDPCGPVGVAHDAPGSFPVGVNPIVVSATDGNGNTATCVTTVEVLDTAPPTITCGAAIATTTDPGRCDTSPTLPAPTASDTCRGDVLTLVDNAPATFGVGTTEVTYTALDAAGHSATCTVSVTVVDDEPLTLSCEAELVRDAPAGLCGWQGTLTAEARDNCAVDATILDESNLYAVGAQTVSFSATNDVGESATCVTALTVRDVTAPSVTCGTPQGTSGTVPVVVVAQAQDACGSTLSLEGLACFTVTAGSDAAPEVATDCPATIDGAALRVDGPTARGKLIVRYVARATDPSGNTATTDCELDFASDLDGDGVPDDLDNCPTLPNTDNTDRDRDGVGDACDLCPGVSDDQADSDGNGRGDACQDTDGDGVLDTADNCPLDANTDQADLDGDGFGDVCDASLEGFVASGSGCASGSPMPLMLGILALLALVTVARRRNTAR